jgi:gluconate:H+ symporter, GntP family
MSVLAAGNSVTAAIAATATDPTRKPWAIHDTEVLIVALLGIAIVVLLIVM